MSRRCRHRHPLDGVSVDAAPVDTAPVDTLGVPAPETDEVPVPDDTVGVGPCARRQPDTIPVPDVPLLPDEFGAPAHAGCRTAAHPRRPGAVRRSGAGHRRGASSARARAVEQRPRLRGLVELRGGEGEATWNALATQCFNGTPTCPRTNPGSNGQLAIVLDGVIQSAPSVNQPIFDGAVSITGNFTQSEAEDLANILNRGAFPVEMVAQEAQTISPAAGQESLRASVIAGLIGLALVLVFLLVLLPLDRPRDPRRAHDLGAHGLQRRGVRVELRRTTR